jgi:hypothetical protein
MQFVMAQCFRGSFHFHGHGISKARYQQKQMVSGVLKLHHTSAGISLGLQFDPEDRDASSQGNQKTEEHNF